MDLCRQLQELRDISGIMMLIRMEEMTGSGIDTVNGGQINMIGGSYTFHHHGKRKLIRKKRRK